MRGPGRRRAAALVVALALAASGCADQRERAGWDSPAAVAGALSGLERPRLPEVEPRTTALDATSRVAITVPRVYRVRLDGSVAGGAAGGGLTTEFSVGGWLLLVAPYPTGGPATTDLNVVDLGLVTDTSPLEARPGALWFGSHTSVMRQLDLGGVTPNAGPVDLVEQTADGDVLVTEVVPGLAAANALNLFAVDEGGTLGAVGAGAVTLRLDPHAAAVTGRVELVDAATGATYAAELFGTSG